jgi:hypothetical protein
MGDPYTQKEYIYGAIVTMTTVIYPVYIKAEYIGVKTARAAGV